MGNSGPIFIVGASRSGTELTRRILNNHSQVGIAAETHYFDDLRPRIGGGQAVLDARDREVATTYFTRVGQHSYSLQSIATAGAAQPLGFAPTGCTGDEMFAAYCADFAAAGGKPIWGEKTPRHVFRGDEILQAFPAARIIMVVRDPRAVVASYRDWQNRWFAGQQVAPELETALDLEKARVKASYSVPVISLMWAAAVRQAQRLRARHGAGRVFILGFEQLLDTPEPTVRDLAEWLGLPFERAMLDVEVINSSYVDHGARTGLDPSSRERWRDGLSADEAGLVSLLTARTASRFGYAASARPSLFYVLKELALTPAFVLRAATANRGRIGSLLPYLTARAMALLPR